MMTSSQEGGSASRMWAICGRSTSGSSAFGRCRVSGRSRVPSPPAMITSCIERSDAARSISIFWPRASLRHDRDDVVPAEHDRPHAPHVVLFRLFRVFEDHVHVVVVADELAFEDAVVLEEKLNALVDGFF